VGLEQEALGLRKGVARNGCTAMPSRHWARRRDILFHWPTHFRGPSCLGVRDGTAAMHFRVYRYVRFSLFLVVVLLLLIN